MSPAGLRGLALLSVLAAVLTMGLKGTAYLVTGSVGLLSDALESGVNLFAAVTAYLALRYSQRPADATHTYGHEKFEFFSSGVEGVLIVVAGIATAWVAVNRLLHPAPLESLGLGTAIALAASLINLAVGILLVRVGRREQSIVLEADGRHLLTDVWTSVAVVTGLVVVWTTGVLVLDPVVAIVVGGNIVFTGLRLIRRSFDGLMDHALPADQQEALRQAIREHSPPGTAFHALRTRQAGARKFADFHLLVPGVTTVRAAHDLGVKVEEALEAALPGVEVTIHIEPIEDRKSWEDHALRGIEPPGVASNDQGPISNDQGMPKAQ
ncbi:MAG TPA: cation diffusion facilitator family transporter [Gemmataceae bacterium]|nr:cation diffusion facilitator family transporter [Gemmataceae bacterium]